MLLARYSGRFSPDTASLIKVTLAQALGVNLKLLF